MKIKTIFIIGIVFFVLGRIVITLGALAKLEHWPVARSLLYGGMALEIIAAIILGIGAILWIKARKELN